MVKTYFLVLFIFGFTLHDSVALDCYTCTAVGSSSLCELDPRNAEGPSPITNCNKKFCTIRRVEDKFTAEVQSFYRSCEDKPIYTSMMIEDELYRTYYYACNEPLCNAGNGKFSNSPNGVNSGTDVLPPNVHKPPLDWSVFHSSGHVIRSQWTLVGMTLIAFLATVFVIYF